MLNNFFISLFVASFCTFSLSAERAEFSQYYDPLSLANLFLPEDPVILEAGAHYGEDTWQMKNKWPKSIIHAFEPYPISFANLEASTRYFSDVFRWPYALNDVPGKFPFYIVANNDGASSLLPPQEYTKVAYAGPCIVVEALNLDAWAQEQNVRHIDFMWLDMEGAELKMLEAAPRILKTVKVIYIETNFWLCRIGTAQYPDLKVFLNSAGFEEVKHWAEVGQGNAVFVRKKLLESFLKNDSEG